MSKQTLIDDYFKKQQNREGLLLHYSGNDQVKKRKFIEENPALAQEKIKYIHHLISIVDEQCTCVDTYINVMESEDIDILDKTIMSLKEAKNKLIKEKNRYIEDIQSLCIHEITRYRSSDQTPYTYGCEKCGTKFEKDNNFEVLKQKKC